MCIGLTIMLTPPLVATTCYVCWFGGQSLVLRQRGRRRLDRQQRPPPFSYSSYALGLAVALPVYYMQRPWIRWMEQSRQQGLQTQSAVPANKTGHSIATTSTRSTTTQFRTPPPHKLDPAVRFQPPQTLAEFWQRMGRPVTARVGALAVSFFCAGAMQAWMDCPA